MLVHSLLQIKNFFKLQSSVLLLTKCKYVFMKPATLSNMFHVNNFFYSPIFRKISIYLIFFFHFRLNLKGHQSLK